MKRAKEGAVPDSTRTPDRTDPCARSRGRKRRALNGAARRISSAAARVFSRLASAESNEGGKNGKRLGRGEGLHIRRSHDPLRGWEEGVLPTVQGPTSLCCALVTKLNPEAPERVLVGNRPDVVRAAVIFSRQKTPVPAFVKKATDEWEFKGIYAVADIIEKKEAARLGSNCKPPSPSYSRRRGLGADGRSLRDWNRVGFGC